MDSSLPCSFNDLSFSSFYSSPLLDFLATLIWLRQAVNQGGFKNLQWINNFSFNHIDNLGSPFFHWTNSNKRAPPSPIPLDKGKKSDDSFFDSASFYWTFSASYASVLLVLVTNLWINSYWRSLWFYFVVWCLLKCFGHFLGDVFCKKIMK
ncbi:hypothetical protein AAHE18_02G078600 [Arachis hypogaea]